MELQDINEIILTKHPYQIKVKDRGKTIALLNTGTVRNDTPESMVKALEKIAQRRAGVYGVEVKLSRNHKDSSTLFYDEVIFGEKAQAIQANHIDERKLRNDIMKEIQERTLLEREKEEIKRLKAELKARIDELDTVSGKLQHMGASLLERILFPMMNGATNSMASTMNQPPQQGSTLNVQQQQDVDNRINRSLDMLFGVMSLEQFEILASTLRDNPEYVGMMMSFVKPKQ